MAAVGRREVPGAERRPARDDEIVPLLHHPERMLVPEVAAYPAIHIDLLPSGRDAATGGP
ncbi:hypothetical protein SALBM311S_04166 [Streptomyces alboniger]